MRFFNIMVFRSLSRQLHRQVLIALTVCLSACIGVAMLGIVFDVGDRLNEELSSYGSNIIVQPKANAVVSDLYDDAQGSAGGSALDAGATSYLKESDAPKIKTIFWAYNITNFAPELDTHAQSNGVDVPIVGTWFRKTLHLDSGETTVVGVQGMRSWWQTQGRWPKDDTDEAMVGKDLAATLGVSIGDTLTLDSDGRTRTVSIVGQFDSGDNDNGSLYMSSALAQDLVNLPDAITTIEVKALTTPENDLARKAARNPAALSQEEWETWYCTAYPSSIAYQIEEVIPGSVSKQVRQVAALQGSVLNKTQSMMILMTVLALIAAAVAVANLMASSISQRSSELALMKAVGASNAAVTRLVLAQTAVVAFIGALLGAALGSGAAQLVGHAVFDTGITMRPMVFVLVFVLLTVTVLVASISAIRSILGLRPAEVLHGR